jgi:hypothetical protein
MLSVNWSSWRDRSARSTSKRVAVVVGTRDFGDGNDKGRPHLKGAWWRIGQSPCVFLWTNLRNTWSTIIKDIVNIAKSIVKHRQQNMVNNRQQICSHIASITRHRRLLDIVGYSTSAVTQHRRWLNIVNLVHNRNTETNWEIPGLLDLVRD